MRPVDTSIDCEYLQRDQPVVYVMYSLAALAMLLFVVALVLLVRLRRVACAVGSDDEDVPLLHIDINNARI